MRTIQKENRDNVERYNSAADILERMARRVQAEGFPDELCEKIAADVLDNWPDLSVGKEREIIIGALTRMIKTSVNSSLKLATDLHDTSELLRKQAIQFEKHL